MKRRKDQTVEQLPETEDLVKLKNFQANVIEQAMSHLTDSPIYTTWRCLAQNVLARLIIFNKRRPGEVARLTLATYKGRPNWKESGHSEITASLQPLEKQLLKTTDLVMVPGKRNRKVPILIPENLSDAMKVLLDKREEVGIPPQNAFFFSSRSTNGHLDGWQAVNASSSGACLKNPQLVTSTKCRKYNATITQLLDLAPTDVEMLANHMGHSTNIHKEFYRLQESTIEITKVGKLLAAVDSGTCLTKSSKQFDRQNHQSVEDSETDLPEQLPAVDSGTCLTKSSRPLDHQNRQSSEDSETDLPEPLPAVDSGTCSKRVRRIPDQDKDHIITGSKAVIRARWTPEEERALRNTFSEHLRQKIYPSASQINIRKKDSPFAARTAAQIKSKLQFMLKKSK